ncbi:Uncharacterised protein [Mycobacteroides abscessus subsp. abscessus]|nr:Uncharacterised protein [Mycobacteroides abscessus subsp. abscessus]
MVNGGRLGDSSIIRIPTEASCLYFCLNWAMTQKGFCPLNDSAYTRSEFACSSDTALAVPAALSRH